MSACFDLRRIARLLPLAAMTACTPGEETWAAFAVLVSFVAGVAFGQHLEFVGHWNYREVRNKRRGLWFWTIREDAELRDIDDHLVSVRVLREKRSQSTAPPKEPTR